MISFSTDGSVQKKNICSCEECLKGAFIKCSYEAGKKKKISMTQVTMKIAKNPPLMMKPKTTHVKVSLKKIKSEQSVLWML